MLVQDESSCINNKVVHKDESIFPAYLPVGLLRPVASPFGRSVSAIVVHKHFHSQLDLIGTRARRRLSVDFVAGFSNVSLCELFLCTCEGVRECAVKRVCNSEHLASLHSLLQFMQLNAVQVRRLTPSDTVGWKISVRNSRNSRV